MMKIKTIEWSKGKIKIIDQTKLPQRLEYLYIDNLKGLWQAIKQLKVRGAPALGAAAALGVYLALKDSRAKDFKEFKRQLDQAVGYLASSRPTARNLFWGLEEMRNTAQVNRYCSLAALKKLLFKKAQEIIHQDMETCRRIGSYGAKLVRNGDIIMTICNAGILATIDYGTALGVVYSAAGQGKKLKVFACETRPLLQGARLTAWELKKRGVDTTLICDNMAASLMQQGKVKKVIAGADRIAANGDTANKIGTYNLAILAKYHRIPFYIAAPASTFDLTIKSGREIVIERRPKRELTALFFKNPVSMAGLKVFNPAFDVTPHQLITAIISDKGVIRPPFRKNIAKILAE